jgi:GAF domain-containing protein
MAEDLSFKTTTREGRYLEVLPQIYSLWDGEDNWVANLANAAAALREAQGFFWVGFYMVQGNELVLGPFQGPVACTRIAKGKGVCGTSWQRAETIIVPDVELFPGHIACATATRSEIVVPIKNQDGKVLGVLDVDSDLENDFSLIDQQYLEELCAKAAKFIQKPIQ